MPDTHSPGPVRSRVQIYHSLSARQHRAHPQSTEETASSTSAPKKRASAKAGFRGDIQALRAFAVMAVIANHLWAGRLTGGFIGVDIFFVISGFLISTHLFKDTLRGRRVRLLEFYARRIRRLLPAAFLVLGLSALGVWLFMPVSSWHSNFMEILASAGYSENIYLTVQAVDYHAIGQKASVAQHYWSLSVEEQFYFLWPMLLMSVGLLAARLGRNIVRFTAWTVGVFTLVFLGFSVWFTSYSPAQAYFVTPVRFWEFGIGALTALIALKINDLSAARPLPQHPSAGTPGAATLPSRIQRRRAQQHHLRRRAVIATFAWVVLALSAYFFSPHIPFPSATAAIPVLATAAIIVMGTGHPLPWLDKITSNPVIRWIGDVSYSLYLWHWPLIVIAPEALGRQITLTDKLVILALTFVLAAISKPLIEDAGMRWTFLTRSVRRTFIMMLGGIIVLASLVGLGDLHGKNIAAAEQARFEAERQRLQEELKKAEEKREAERVANAEQAHEAAKPVLPCLGPGSLLHGDQCTNAYDQPLSVSLGPDNDWNTRPDECTVDKAYAAGKFGGVVICDFRDDPQSTSRQNTVILVGDSHADQWKWALRDIAQRRKLRIEALMVGGCPVRLFPNEAVANEQSYQFGHDCTEGVKAITDYIAKNPAPRIIYSTYAKTEHLRPENGVEEQQTLYNRAMSSVWSSWLQSGSGHVYVIHDTPYNDAVRDINCLTRAQDPVIECRVERERALGKDPLPGAVAFSNSEQITAIDFTDAFCDDQFCYAVAGQMPVFFDPTHLNRQYSLLLAPLLEWELNFDQESPQG